MDILVNVQTLFGIDTFIVPVLLYGSLYSITALGMLLSFRVIRYPDLTAEGSYVIGAVVTAIFITNGSHPLISIAYSILAGVLSGLITVGLHLRLKVNRILSGILVLTMLYTINLRVLQRSNLPIDSSETILSWAENLGGNGLFATLFIMSICFLLATFVFLLLKSEVGLLLRAVGESEKYTQAVGRNFNMLLLVGMCVSNGIVAFSGSIATQHFGFADVNMGTGILVGGLACLFIGSTIISKIGPLALVLGSIIGSFIYAIARNIVLRIGFETMDLKLITGVIIIVILSIKYWRNGSITSDEEFSI